MESDRESNLERLRQAEKNVPGLKDKMQQEGYTEQELAELVDQRLSGGETSQSRTRGPFRPSEHPIGLAVVLALGAFLGYFQQFDTGHNSDSQFPGGWVGALIAAGVLLGVFAVMELSARWRSYPRLQDVDRASVTANRCCLITATPTRRARAGPFPSTGRRRASDQDRA